MEKVKNLVNNDVAWMVEQINELYRQGKIQGISVQMLQIDGEYITGSSGEMSYLEKLGLVESAKQDIMLSANGLIES